MVRPDVIPQHLRRQVRPLALPLELPQPRRRAGVPGHLPVPRPAQGRIDLSVRDRQAPAQLARARGRVQLRAQPGGQAMDAQTRATTQAARRSTETFGSNEITNPWGPRYPDIF